LVSALAVEASLSTNQWPEQSAEARFCSAPPLAGMAATPRSNAPIAGSSRPIACSAAPCAVRR
jgi:hypothetical protein